MTLTVSLLPALDVVMISQDGASVFIRRDQTTELMALIVDAVVETIGEPDTYSRKVPATPALRLVGDIGGDVKWA